MDMLSMMVKGREKHVVDEEVEESVQNKRQ